MKLSFLDLLATPRESVELVSIAEALGYHRYWVGEHHNRTQCGNPLMLSAVMAAYTERIRLGTGATSLLLRSPYLIAEDARLLVGLFGDRLDLGVAPALESAPAVIDAIADGRSVSKHAYGDRMRELHGYLTGRVDDTHPLKGLGRKPGPPLWALGQGPTTVALAAELGLGLCISFHHGATIARAAEAIASYRAAFRPSEQFAEANAIAVISGFCSESPSLVERHRKASFIGTGSNYARTVDFFAGSAESTDLIRDAASKAGADEVMVLSLAFTDVARSNAAMLASLAKAWMD